MFALRVDDCFDAVKDWLNTQGFGGFAVEEHVDGGNRHWHLLLETSKQISAVRTSLNRAVPNLKGNGKYSLTEVKDVDKYRKYMAKGESDGQAPAVVWRNSILYTDEYVENLHAAYWEANRKMRKRKAGSMVDHVIDAAKAAGIQWDDRKKLARLYISMLAEHQRPISLYSVKASLNTVMCALCPDDKAVDLLAGHCEAY